MDDLIFQQLSPLDHRYHASNPELFRRMSSYLSEAAFLRCQLEVEVALVRALAARGLCPASVADEVAAAAAQVTAQEVARWEEITRHNVRALVNALRDRVSDEAKPYIHFTATSVDILDTARALQYKRASQDLLLPQLRRLLAVLIRLTRQEAATPQVGRTHGQHAVPITFGFALAEYVSRLGARIQRLEEAASQLRGKMAGAVGAYNASHLFFDDPEAFEREVLAQLDLLPGGHSTQIVEPEYVLDFAHAAVSTFGVLANLADDLRHLQRTEIGEVGEAFDPQQVGSSTMPHKRNPWNFEHVKSLWKAFVPRIMTLYMDQISEHQRDLTNSASSRFFPEVLAGLMLAAARLEREIGRLGVDRERMAANLRATQEMVVAEPLYILLAALGHPDAHEAVRKLTLEAEKTGRPLRELAQESADLRPYLERMSDEQRRVIRHPESYRGIAEQKALSLCEQWEAYLRKRGVEV